MNLIPFFAGFLGIVLLLGSIPPSISDPNIPPFANPNAVTHMSSTAIDVLDNLDFTDLKPFEISEDNFILPIREMITKNSTDWAIDMNSSIESYSEYKIDTNKMVEQSKSRKTTPIILNGTTYHMQLEESNFKSPNAWTRATLENGTTVDLEPLDIKNYKGNILGLEDKTSIRITIYEDWISGFVNNNFDTFHIESMKNELGEYNQKYMIYKATDIQINDKSSPSNPLDVYSSLPTIDLTKYSFPLFSNFAYAVTNYDAKIILDCDEEFVNLDSVHWTARQQATFNSILEPYQDLGINLILVGQACDETNADLVGTNTDDLWVDLQQRWQIKQDQRHVVHLFTGKVLDDTDRVGFAGNVIPAIDDPWTRGYSLVQHAADSQPLWLPNTADKQRLMAHEIGHNFGGIHSKQGICEDSFLGPCTVFFNSIMCTRNPLQTGFCNPLISSKVDFSDGSISSNQDNGKVLMDNAALYLTDQFPIKCLNLPSVGDWIITKDCTLKTNYIAPLDVSVENNSVLIIPNNISLTIDFDSEHLMIKSGSQVMIKDGGMISSP